MFVAFNATNTLYVWACDRMGNCGAAASASVLVLDPAGDADGDGLINASEEIAGTDARDRARTLQLTASIPSSADVDTGRIYILNWDSAAGRLYSLNAATNLPDDAWYPLLTNQAGTGGTLSYTDRMDNALHRFYRLRVAAP